MVPLPLPAPATSAHRGAGTRLPRPSCAGSARRRLVSPWRDKAPLEVTKEGRPDRWPVHVASASSSFPARHAPVSSPPSLPPRSRNRRKRVLALHPETALRTTAPRTYEHECLGTHLASPTVPVCSHSAGCGASNLVVVLAATCSHAESRTRLPLFRTVMTAFSPAFGIMTEAQLTSRILWGGKPLTNLNRRKLYQCSSWELCLDIATLWSSPW